MGIEDNILFKSRESTSRKRKPEKKSEYEKAMHRVRSSGSELCVG